MVNTEIVQNDDGYQIKEPKQETVEQAAETIALYSNSDFIKGAKWQAERMYSEKEVIVLLQKYRFDLSSGTTPVIGDTTGVWFQQFKKKI
jgi:hypothetical protein